MINQMHGSDPVAAKSKEIMNMAGGENAEYVPCGKCSARAIRVSEGIETDWYRCTQCAAEFGIDWDGKGPPA